MAQKVTKVGVKRDNNFLYYVGKTGDVMRVARKQPGAKKGKPEKVAAAGVTKESGFLYFIDGQGDVSRSKMAVGGQKRKKKAAPKAKARTTVKKKTAMKGKKR